MSSHQLLLALSVPLVLTACSSSSDSAKAPLPSVSASPTPTIPVATGYLVTAGPDVTSKDLDEAAVKLRELEGVVKVTKVGNDQLRVELTLDKIPDDGAEIRTQLQALGTVVVP